MKGIYGQYHIWDLFGIWDLLGLKTKFFVGKTTNYIFPWKRDSQCQNSADSLAENTPNASKNFSPICLPKPKSFGFLKKSSLWVSVVRGSGLFYFHGMICEFVNMEYLLIKIFQNCKTPWVLSFLAWTFSKVWFWNIWWKIDHKSL